MTFFLKHSVVYSFVVWTGLAPTLDISVYNIEIGLLISLFMSVSIYPCSLNKTAQRTIDPASGCFTDEGRIWQV